MDEIVETPVRAIAPAQQNAVAPANPVQLMAIAVQQGADLDRLERLMEMQLKWEANEARKAFADAFAEFKAKEIVKITKDKHVSYQGAKGQVDYDHATIGNVVKTITEAISKYGFSHAWATKQQGSTVYVTCTLRHKLGHFEEVTLSAEPDTSGGKNSIQGIGSAITYLQRYTLLAITGCATSDQPDDDGKAAGTAEQAIDLLTNELVAKVKAATDDKAALKVWQENNAKLADWPASHDVFKQAVVDHRTALREAKAAAA
jgi:hypothetical protein